MADLVSTYAPNMKLITHDPDSTDWEEVSGFPGLDPGQRYVAAVIRSVDSTGKADGSGLQFLCPPQAMDVPDASDQGKFLSGGGQTETIPGGAPKLYVKQNTLTDLTLIEVWY